MDLNASISIVYMKEIKGLLTKFKDVFAWSYKELKGLPKKIVKVKLNSWLAHDQSNKSNIA
jgi:hypothetical protein